MWALIQKAVCPRLKGFVDARQVFKLGNSCSIAESGLDWAYQLSMLLVLLPHFCGISLIINKFRSGRALNGSAIERITQRNFLGLTIHENMNSKSHSSKIANKSWTSQYWNKEQKPIPPFPNTYWRCTQCVKTLHSRVTSKISNRTVKPSSHSEH